MPEAGSNKHRSHLQELPKTEKKIVEEVSKNHRRRIRETPKHSRRRGGKKGRFVCKFRQEYAKICTDMHFAA
jgi:hypothetical protein